MKTRQQSNSMIRTVGAGLAMLAAALMSTSAMAQTGTMFVTGDQVGVGTDAPAEKLHVKDGAFKVEETTSGVPAKLVFETPFGFWDIKQNGATGRLTYANSNTAGAPMKMDPTAINNLLRVGTQNPNEVTIGGNLVINGGTCTGCADYVFEDDYELLPLEEVGAFIAENGHLPNVPSADEMGKSGYNVGQMSGTLLAKIEELTLYTLQQQKVIDELQVTIHELRAEK